MFFVPEDGLWSGTTCSSLGPLLFIFSVPKEDFQDCSSHVFCYWVRLQRFIFLYLFLRRGWSCYPLPVLGCNHNCFLVLLLFRYSSRSLSSNCGHVLGHLGYAFLGRGTVWIYLTFLFFLLFFVFWFFPSVTLGCQSFTVFEGLVFSSSLCLLPLVLITNLDYKNEE